MKPNKLQEGEDYTVEDGLLVFTRKFHLKRGSCCKSGCKHCPYGFKQDNFTRIVSLVPSWTETLITCNVPVVGRTRFCIHPNQNHNIAIVGGTKKINWPALTAVEPDLLIVDQEENTLEIAETATVPLFISQITSIADVAKTCEQLADKLKNKPLQQFAEQWQLIHHQAIQTVDYTHIPGLIEWINQPVYAIKKIVYIIWRDPWMSVSGNCFIGSVLEKLGMPNYFYDAPDRYPIFNLSELPQDTLLLFSSEPYPFDRKKAELRSLPYAAAFVDGESYSWFGVRSLRFLQQQLGI